MYSISKLVPAAAIGYRCCQHLQLFGHASTEHGHQLSMGRHYAFRHLQDVSQQQH
jgi:hypothetical protein